LSLRCQFTLLTVCWLCIYIPHCLGAKNCRTTESTGSPVTWMACLGCFVGFAQGISDGR
jgi:hypothetical protein